MANDFTGATQTVKGIAVRNVTFNPIPGKWLGQVWDNTALRENNWNKLGKATNRSRPELDLK